MFNKVIVFGPTGKVASIAAITAQNNGSKVYLAMRDPKKSISVLSKEAEAAGGYERLQADLTKPETVITAAKESGAKSAFIYVAHGSPDHMKATIEALKAGGIEFVVFLSSFTVQGEPSNISSKDVISYAHAQIEIGLQEVFGEDFVAVRPGAFATNTLMWKDGIKAGELKTQRPDSKLDMITPDDMGRVAGVVLSKGKQDGEQHIYLFGPQLITEREAATVIGKALGKNVKTVTMTKEEGVDHFKSQGMPPHIAEYLAEANDKMVRAGTESMLPVEMFEKEVGNVEKYSGKPGLKFEDWVNANKALYTAEGTLYG